MALGVVVLIRDNPMETHRPVEGLRIALGLSTGSSSLTIILVGDARRLLTDDASDVVDAEILEKHLPVIQELQLPIVIPEGSHKDLSIDEDFSVREASETEIADLLCHADRVLAF